MQLQLRMYITSYVLKSVCLSIIMHFTVPVFQVQEFVLLLSQVFQKAPGVPHQTLAHSVETQNKNHWMEKF